MKEEIISALTEVNDKIKNSEEVKELSEKLNTTQNTLVTITEKIIELPFVQSYFKNFTKINIQNISDAKLYDVLDNIEKLKARLEEDEKNLNNLEKMSEKINYIVNKYYMNNDELNSTLVNETLYLFIPFLEKIENSYKEIQSPKGEEIYNK